MSVLLDLFKQNRGKLGWFVGVLAAGLEAKGYAGLAAGAGMLATLLLGAGHFESDAYHQGK